MPALVFQPVEEVLGVKISHDASTFEVRASSEEDLDVEIKVRADQVHLLPSGTYRLYLCGPGLISPTLVSMVRSPQVGAPFKTINAPVVPSGRILLSGRTPPSRRGTVHFLSLNLPLGPDGGVPAEMSRRTSLEEAFSTGADMPSGSALAALVDATTGEYLAISPAIGVLAGMTAKAELTIPPKGYSAVAASFSRSSPAGLMVNAEQDLQLVDSSGKLFKPDLVLPSRFQHYAFWFRVPSGNVSLVSRGAVEGLPPTAATLRSEKIERLRLDLRPHPRLSVVGAIPPALRKLDFDLEVREVSGAWAQNRKGKAADFGTQLLVVPPAPFELTLRVGRFLAREMVDLSDGADRQIELHFELVEVTGTVRSDDPMRSGSVVFNGEFAKESTAFSIDDDGRYAAILTAGYYDARVRVPGRDRMFRVGPVEFLRSTEFDIEIPANRFEVRILDEETGTGIPEAELRVHYSDGEVAYSDVSIADSDGLVRLEPLQEGALRLIAMKQGYVRSEQHVEPIGVDSSGREIELRLTPEGASIDLVVKLAKSSPAIGARACVFSNPSTLAWSGATDDRGVVTIPRRLLGLSGVLLHSTSAFATFVVSEDQTPVDLPMRAPQPLRVAVVSGTGEPVKSAGVVLWSRGLRLSPQVLACAAPGESAVPLGGMFTLSTAPAEPLEVLFLNIEGESVPLGLAGALDSERVAIPYPWPSILTVRAE
ncbi:MAG: hypothetical protein IT382_11150 [Deltaproteobacteria bacterium]|nr:hypothetical protein [Deltaproteobacteria bacterium]